MKKNNFLLIIFLLISTICMSQLYVKTYSGYAFSTNPVKFQNIEVLNNIENIYVSKYKMGQGINAGLSLGYTYNRTLSFEITANTQIFSSKKYYIPQKDLSNAMSAFTSGQFGHNRYTNSLLQIAPQIIYTVDYNKNIAGYIKAGPNFLITKTKFENNSIQIELDSTGWHNHQVETGYIQKGNINIGIQSSVGVEYRISKKVYCLFEFISVINHYEYKTEETVIYKIDGADHLNDINPRLQKITDGTKTNFSQCGFNIGIKYLL